jgi:hypothetical protein
MSDDPTDLPGCQVAVLSVGEPPPEPSYCDEARLLICDLCRDAVDALWLLSPHRPPDLGWGLADGELFICRRCADAVRPVPKLSCQSRRRQER